MRCPKCGFPSCTLTTSTKVTGKDYSVGKGLLGEMLFGSAGFSWGFSNRREMDVQAYWVCKQCGHREKA